MLDRQPTLQGEHLLLRPLTERDWSGLFDVASDPLIWDQHPAHDRWKEDVFRAFFEDALANEGALAVVAKPSGQIIGSSRYQGLESEDGGSVEIGWTFLGRDHWGTGANREMKRLMVAHALSSVAECRFAVGEENWRSRKAMEKIGGRLVEREETVRLAGVDIRHVYYVIDRDDFARGPLSQS